jgi:hypothetical protein
MPARRRSRKAAKPAKKAKQPRWSAARLMKRAPATPAMDGTPELLARIKSTLRMPAAPARRRGGADMADVTLQIDPAASIEVNFVTRSKHVVAYRLWDRDTAQGQWQVVADGHTADHVPDLVSVPKLPRGAQIAFWLGIGGDPNSQYEALVTVSQSGKILDNGSLIERGGANDKGVAEVQVLIDLT